MRAALNRTATTFNPESKSPYEMWDGNPPAELLFLKPGYCKVKEGEYVTGESIGVRLP